jgi:hypothetical protein
VSPGALVFRRHRAGAELLAAAGLVAKAAMIPAGDRHSFDGYELRSPRWCIFFFLSAFLRTAAPCCRGHGGLLFVRQHGSCHVMLLPAVIRAEPSAFSVGAIRSDMWKPLQEKNRLFIICRLKLAYDRQHIRRLPALKQLHNDEAVYPLVLPANLTRTAGFSR